MKTYFALPRPASRKFYPFYPAIKARIYTIQGGFSLSELMITLGLMAIIASLAIPSITKKIEIAWSSTIQTTSCAI